MMREQPQSEFAELQTKALHALEHVDAPVSFRRSYVALQLWEYPAFAKYISWTIFTDKDGNMVLKQMIWDRPDDTERFMDPIVGLKKGWHIEPTLTNSETSLDQSEIVRRITIANTIAIPLVGIKSTVRLDAVTYGLQIPASYNSFRLQWWCNGPEEWRELTTWAADMRTYLLEAFNKP